MCYGFTLQVGMCKQAVAAYTKTGKVCTLYFTYLPLCPAWLALVYDTNLIVLQIKESIQVCVTLNQWDQAVSLGSQYHIKEIDALLAKYASHLLGKNKILDAIEVSQPT